MNISVMGIGNMGQALITGIVRSGFCEPAQITMYDPDSEKLIRFSQVIPCKSSFSAAEAVGQASIVIIAVKPQHMARCLEQIAPYLQEQVLVASLVAGVTMTYIRSMLGAGRKGIVRVMPNTPAMIGQGMSAVSFIDTTPEEEAVITRILETVGTVLRVDEQKMNAVTGLSGSGPGFVMIFIEAMADAGVKNGLTRDEALLLAATTVRGAAAMVIETNQHPAQIKDQICSPGGTTIEGVQVLESKAFRAAVMEAVTASTLRCEKLAEDRKKNG